MSLVIERSQASRFARLPRSMHILRTRLRTFATGPELLYDLMGFGSFTEMAMTRDGVLIARPRRGAGFDAVLGRPTEATLDRTHRLWLELEPALRALVLQRLKALDIAPARVGIHTSSGVLAAPDQEIDHGR